MGELRVGDRVELVGEIVQIGNEEHGISVRFGCHVRWLDGKFVGAGKLLPRPLVIEDLIRRKAAATTGTTIGVIKAIDGNQAWVHWKGDPLQTASYLTEVLSDLERA